MAAHAGACRAAGVSFIPLVVESLGGWSYEAIQTIKSIGRLQTTLGASSTGHYPTSFPASSHRTVERECVAVGQAAASPFSNDRWTCLTFVFSCFLCLHVLFFWGGRGCLFVCVFCCLFFVFLLLSFTLICLVFLY